MHLEKYNLTWQNYSDHLKVMMKELMINDELADVTLVSEDRNQIKAHKIIISACSSVLKEILKLDQSAKTIIYLRGINISELESLMQYIYQGETKLDREKINEFLDLARSLEIKELFDAKTKTKDDNEPSQNDTITSTDNSERQTRRSCDLMGMAPKEFKDGMDRVRVNAQYNCEQCNKTFASLPGFNYHRQSAHMGMRVSSILVISVTTNLHSKVVLKNTLSQYMKVSSMLVISVNTRQPSKGILKCILSQIMKVSGIIVISVTTNVQDKVVLMHILSQNMKVSGMIAVSVTIQLQIQVILLDTLNQNMKVLHMLVISATIKLQQKEVLKCILNQNMMGLSMIAISVTTKLQEKLVLKDTLSQNMMV